MRRLGGLVGTFLLAAAAAGCGGAEPSKDDQFLDALVEADVVSEADADADREVWIEQARAWCENISDPSTTREDVDAAIARMSEGRDGVTAAKAALFFGTAAQTYCPKAAERLQ